MPKLPDSIQRPKLPFPTETWARLIGKLYSTQNGGHGIYAFSLDPSTVWWAIASILIIFAIAWLAVLICSLGSDDPCTLHQLLLQTVSMNGPGDAQIK